MTIEDESLAVAIEQQLNKANLQNTEKDLPKLTALQATSNSIASLKGLESADNLTYLSVPNAHIDNFGPISSLTKLKQLNCGR